MPEGCRQIVRRRETVGSGRESGERDISLACGVTSATRIVRPAVRNWDGADTIHTEPVGFFALESTGDVGARDRLATVAGSSYKTSACLD